MTKQDWLKYVGNMSQVAGVTELVSDAGKTRGMRVWHVKTGNGLVFDLLPDMCMNIMDLSWRGVNISWQSKNGYAAGVYGYPVLNEFDRYFGGGMLWTCGLKNTGGDYIDSDGRFQHLHGRLGLTPCESAWHRECWEGDDYVIEAGGTVRDSILTGHDLVLVRTLRVGINEPSVEVEDVIENQEPEEQEYLSLYHFNFGYPFVSPGLEQDYGQETEDVLPRTENARDGMEQMLETEPPVDGYEEQCFFHHQKSRDGWCRVNLKNRELGIGVTLEYEKENLPILTQWKSVRSGEYVLGVEPGNSYLRGLAAEQKDGTVGHIRGFEKKTNRLRLSFSTL
ncbi:MAG: aldose 1-epimerase family protein [Bilifractor sp.]|jgi:hypothetical protein